MASQLQFNDITVDVIKKDIKNVHLSVHPPSGRVRIAAPSHMPLDTIRVFALSKLAWIKRQQGKFREQERETPREYLNRESHYVWGKRYLLVIRENGKTPSVELKHNRIVLTVRPGADTRMRREILEEWYRSLLKQAVPELVLKWRPILKVGVNQVFVRRMKTKWGSCNPASSNIRLNTDLAKKPYECLEYIFVHEMVHLLEPTHNERFQTLMDQFAPKWRSLRQLLNQLPVRHEEWSY